MSAGESKLPNVVFILSDDQGAWAMNCGGSPEIRTPNLDRLAKTGIRFENFFCACPVCSPARSSIFTGRIPSQHGVHDWIRIGNVHQADPDRVKVLGAVDRPIDYLEGLTAYTEILDTAGYYCGLSGKWHMGDSQRPQKAFKHWFTHQWGGDHYYNASMVRDGELYREPVYVSDAITEDALEFIDKHYREPAPFYLSVHYTAPHSPWGRDEHPKDLVDSYIDNEFKSFPVEPDHPWHTDSRPQHTGERRRELLAGFCASITAMDAGIGRILDKLETLGLREDTLVFFTSDNGMNMGHHGIWGKGNGTFPQNMYDTSVKIPAIISRPGSIAQNVVDENLHSHYDWMPTLLDYLNLENPEASLLPGRSFASLLRGEKSDGHGRVVVFDEYGPVRMIRDKEWKYIHRIPYGPHELYHLSHDPEERNNLIDDPSLSDKVAEMKAGLFDFFATYADPQRDGAHEAVYGRGQIERVGPKGAGRKAFQDVPVARLGKE